MATMEKLYATVKDLPESEIAELLDFAEFLWDKRHSRQHTQVGDGLLVELKGGLENSTTFADKSLVIQDRLRVNNYLNSSHPRKTSN